MLSQPTQSRFLYWRTIRPVLIWLLIAACITAIVTTFILPKTPERFTSEAKIYDLITKLCLSYISAFIFYFVVVHMKAQQDRRNLYRYIYSWTDQVVGRGKGTISEMRQAASVAFTDEYPSESQLIEIATAIGPNMPSPLSQYGAGTLPWKEYLKYQRKHTDDAIKRIYLNLIFVDSELIKLLLAIDQSPFFMSVDAMSQFPLTNTNYLMITKEIHQYLEHIKALETYAKTKLAQYV